MADIYNRIQSLQNLSERRKAIKTLSDEEKCSYLKYQQSINKKKCKPNDDIQTTIIPSKEQSNILQKLQSGHNCICNSVAGAGKTTTVIMLARDNPDKNILLVTYNSMLKEEVRKKAKPYPNLEVHNYHALAKCSYIKYHKDYDHNTVFNNILDNNLPLLRSNTLIDILVIDETQDMELIFFKFLQKFVDDINNPQLQYLIMGDNNQAVYEFKGSDARFLTMADKIWQLPMVITSLTTSYRITYNIANFVNEIMLNKPSFITASKEGPNVQFIIEKRYRKYQVAKYIKDYLVKLIKSSSIKADDIYVLVGSLKGENKPYQDLEHMLVDEGINCYVSNKEESNKKSVTTGKVVFTTFHQSKGGERPIVILYDFDHTYFEYYNRNKPDNVCCPELYVAATRASQQLIVVQLGPQLKFLNTKKLISASYVDFPLLTPNVEADIDDLQSKKPEMTIKCSPREMIKYLPEDVKNMCALAVEDLFQTIKTPSDKSFKLPATMKRKNKLEEDICDLIGLAIPAIFEKNIKNKSSIEKECEANFQNTRHEKNAIRTKFYFQHLGEDPYLFKTANLCSCIRDNINNRLSQIDDYNWLSNEQVNICLNNLQKNVSYHCDFEVNVGNEGDEADANLSKYILDHLGREFFHKHLFSTKIKIEGQIDAIDDEIVWEFKCVNELSLENKLQVILYAFIWKIFHEQFDGKRKFRLLNIVNGEVLELNTLSHMFDQVVAALLRHKIETKDAISDEKFIKNCLQRP